MCRYDCNVWEWCNDWFSQNEYQQRANKIVKDPQGPKEGTLRVLHGGSYNRAHGDTRAATRRANDPLSVGEAKGFRVATSSAQQDFAKVNISSREHQGEDFTRE